MRIIDLQKIVRFFIFFVRYLFLLLFLFFEAHIGGPTILVAAEALPVQTDDTTPTAMSHYYFLFIFYLKK